MKNTQVFDESALIIVAHITAKDAAYKDDLLKAFEAVIAGTRQEPGNVFYILHEHVDNPLKFTLLEGWKSQEAIDYHNNTPHFKALGEAVEGKAELDIVVMKHKM